MAKKFVWGLMLTICLEKHKYYDLSLTSVVYYLLSVPLLSRFEENFTSFYSLRCDCYSSDSELELG